jgi:phytoene synthase
VVATTSEPALGAIRLAWWRERLEELDGGVVPAEPRLSAVARQLLGRGITGKELSQLEDGWLALLQPFPWRQDVPEGLRLRGKILFGIGARLLGGEPQEVLCPGELWSLVDAANHCSDTESRELLVEEALDAVSALPRAMSRATRSLTVLAALAACDVLGKGRVARGKAALTHRLKGTFPRG